MKYLTSFEGDVFENNKNDDNSPKWEDSVEESDKSSIDEKTFLISLISDFAFQKNLLFTSFPL